MKFLCLAYGDGKDWEVLSKTEQAELLAQDDLLMKRGGILATLGPATTVRAWDGTPVTASGPYARTELPLVGFSLIEARDLEEAIALVSKTPCAVAKGVIEVWPVRTLD